MGLAYILKMMLKLLIAHTHTRAHAGTRTYVTTWRVHMSPHGDAPPHQLPRQRTTSNLIFYSF